MKPRTAKQVDAMHKLWLALDDLLDDYTPTGKPCQKDEELLEDHERAFRQALAEWGKADKKGAA